jgi:hypothetical protein
MPAELPSDIRKSINRWDDGVGRPNDPTWVGPYNAIMSDLFPADLHRYIFSSTTIAEETISYFIIYSHDIPYLILLLKPAGDLLIAEKRSAADQHMRHILRTIGNEEMKSKHALHGVCTMGRRVAFYEFFPEAEEHIDPARVTDGEDSVPVELWGSDILEDGWEKLVSLSEQK